MTKEDHVERTANEPRDPSLHTVILKRIDEINDTIRVFRLEIPVHVGGVKFLPGQWLDTYVPGIQKPGGFTITSPPSKAQPNKQDSSSPPPYLELAIQKSPDNAVAHWLWQPTNTILGQEIRVRVGGSFVWPAPGIIPSTLHILVFVAGGVGINPLMSIVSHLAEQPGPRYNVQFLYSMKDPGPDGRKADNMLCLERLAFIFAREKVRGDLKLFLTGGGAPDAVEKGKDVVSCNDVDIPFERRRITADDVSKAIGDDKQFSVVYICGVPGMTDQLVTELTSSEGQGLEPHRVLYEKWW